MATRGSEPSAKTGHDADHANRRPEPGSDAPPQEHPASVLDDVLLAELSEDVGVDSVRGLVRGFIHLVPRRLEAVRRASDAGDAESLKEMSHTLAGSAAYVGARQVVLQCRRLEAAAEASELGSVKQLIDGLDRALETAIEALQIRWRP